MATSTKNPKLTSKTGRAELERRRKPYFRLVEPGLYVGYRRNKDAGTWVARWRDPAGGYVTKTIADADDMTPANRETVLDFSGAQQRARELFAKSKGRAYRNGPYTVRAAVEDYLETLAKRGKSAADSRGRAEIAIMPELGDIDCETLTRKTIREWHERLAEQPRRLRQKPGATDPEAVRRRKSTANRILTILKAALNQAFMEERVSSDAAWRSVKPFRGVDAARLRFLEVDECKRLINACQPDFRKLVRGALVTGARYGELTRLEVADFHEAGGTVHVRDSKSAKPRRVILSDEGVELFRTLTAGRRPDARIFLRDDGQPWGKAHQSRPMAAACEAARIDPPASFHVLRHTYASLLAMNGAPLIVVAQNLGHADTRMVDKHYAHLAASYSRQVIRDAVPEFGLEPSTVTPMARGASDA